MELMDKEVGRDCVLEPCRVIDLIGSGGGGGGGGEEEKNWYTHTYINVSSKKNCEDVGKR